MENMWETVKYRNTCNICLDSRRLSLNGEVMGDLLHWHEAQCDLHIVRVQRKAALWSSPKRDVFKLSRKHPWQVTNILLDIPLI